jgi:hypothetical protein
MAKAFTAFLLHLFGIRAARGYQPERHSMRGPGPKCRAL